jgi:glycosyltransferase involved in cell wall biosynthesis
MRILFVVPNVPSLVRPRPFHFIRRLSEMHELSVVCLATNETDERSIFDLRRYCHRLEVIRHSRRRALLNCLAALVTRASLRCAYFYSPRLHVEHLKSLPMVEPLLGKVPAVFDSVDCLSMLESRRRRVTKNLLVKLFSSIESKKFAVSEARAPRRFNRVAISSPVDRDAYPVPADLRERIDIVANGVDLDHFRFREFEAQRNLLVFCAKLDYFPNADAALHFARSIWPRVRARRPELRLEIVGSRPPLSVRRLDGQANIRVIGSVPDVKPYLGRAWVALCPIRIRAGIQNKMLEAMALGVPVVATSICCPGLEVEAQKHLLVADGAEQFAAAIELLVDNEILREKLIETARDYVERHHNWAESVKALSNSYRKAMADFRAGAGAVDLAFTVPEHQR